MDKLRATLLSNLRLDKKVEKPPYKNPDLLLGLSFEKFQEKVGLTPNRLDFTRCEASGCDLGEIIGAVFLEEVSKVQAWHSDLAEQQRETDLSMGRDVNGTYDKTQRLTKPVHLKVVNKLLGDGGLRYMVEETVEALTKKRRVSLGLEDISLAGNDITTQGLLELIKIIEVSKDHLKTIDLSNNDIYVITDLDVMEFEKFLKVLSKCSKLRRLDLSGNKQLAAKGAETIARVYFREQPVKPFSLPEIDSITDLDVDDEESARLRSLYLHPRMQIPKTAKDFTMNKPGQGLRGLAYINLSDTGLHDVGALWLAQILPHHYFPVQLLAEHNAAAYNSENAMDQQTREDTGIEWLTNEDTLNIDGINLLTAAEELRKSIHIERASDAAPVAEPVFEPYPLKSARDVVVDVVPKNKIAGITEDEKTKIRVMQITMKAIQRNAIAETTLQVDIWNAALKIVVLSRRLYKNCCSSMSVAQQRVGMQTHMALATSYAGRACRWQEERKTRCSADSELPWVLPFALWHKILGFVITNPEMNCLSERQHRLAYMWGMERRHLATEREWVKLDKGHQMWMLLSHVGCLQYETE